jgi:major membrane immunogen (membrane-anchored lipoprotein)
LKKILLTILLIGAISLVGCGKKEKTATITNPDGTKTSTVTSPEGKQTITTTTADGKVMSVRTK